MKKGTLGIYFVFFVAVCVLAMSVRGLLGVPSIAELNNKVWTDDGPLELSPDRGRFALLYSIVEEKTVHFSLSVARFATPDLGYHAGKYVSLFAPGVSFIVAPGYLIGKYFGASQVGAYATITVFAALNMWLLYGIARLLKATPWAAILGAMTFIFATPAFAYAVSLYQHHISIFLFLSSLYCLIRWKEDFRALIIVWLCVASSVVVDYPNAVLFSPIIIYALYQTVGVIFKGGRWAIRINPTAFMSPIVILLPLALFMWFNQASYGNPWQLAGTVASVKEIDANGNPQAPSQLGTDSAETFSDPTQQDKVAVNFFQSRNILNGFIIHFISLDRGMLVYTPVMLFGLLGLAFGYKQFPHATAVILAAIGANILLYSMWSDPWGGWAFGSRYLILSYALLSIFIALGLSVWRKNWLVLALFFILFTYSASVNTLGALSTNANPPKIEAAALEKLSGISQPYTYEHNYEYILSDHSKSFVWQTFLNPYFSALQYYQLLVAIIVTTCLASLASLVIYDRP